MKLAVTYLVKSFLIWATVRTICQLVNTFGEEYTTFQALKIERIRFSIRVCFGYTSVILIHKSNNKTTEDCAEIFGEKQCELWREDEMRSSRFYLRGFAPRKFIEFGRRVFTKNRMIASYNTSRYDQYYYLAQQMFCVLFKKNSDFPDDFFKMTVNSKIRLSKGAGARINLRVYINNEGSYPNKNDYIFSTSLKELRKSAAVVILLRQELFVQHDMRDLDEFLEHVRTKHGVNRSLRFCRYHCEREFQLHNPTLLYLDRDENVTLSEEKLLDQQTVNDIVENCVLKHCHLSNDVNNFFTVAGLARITEEELGPGDGHSQIYMWFYMSDLIFKRSKLCLLDFVINIGFAFSLYFGYNLIGLGSIAECLAKQKWRLNKLNEVVLLFLSIFFFVKICGHYYGQIGESEMSRYSRFFPGFSNFTFSVCFPLANLLKNRSQTFDRIRVRELDEMTLGLEDIIVGFSLLNMATLKRSKIQPYGQSRSFYFRKDKCFSFNVNKSAIFAHQAFFEEDEKLREVYSRLFERYFQLYLIFDQTFLIYVTEYGLLPYYYSEFTNGPMTFLKLDDQTRGGSDFVSLEMQAKYQCKVNSECINKCFLSKTLRKDADGKLHKSFQYDAVVEPSQLESSLLDLPFKVLNRGPSLRIEQDCWKELDSWIGRRFSFSSYISSRTLGISELLLLQLSMPSNIYSIINSNELFDIILNLFGCYFLIFGSSFYSAAFLLKTYLKSCTIPNSNRSVPNQQRKFVQPDKFWRAFFDCSFDVSFILTCIAGLYVLLSATYDSVKENPTIVSHQFSKYG